MSSGDYKGPYTPPRSAPPPGDTFPALGGTSAPEVGSLEYWRRRALAAENQVRAMSKRASEDSWRISNYQEEARIRRDIEIGEMGGGG